LQIDTPKPVAREATAYLPNDSHSSPVTVDADALSLQDPFVQRLPSIRNCVIEKQTLKDLEQILIEKAQQFFRHMLLARRANRNRG
jgi:hypothetical protein